MHAFGFWSLVPALVAIGLALWTRNVILSLFVAIATGGIIAAGGDPVAGLAKTADEFLLTAVADKDHAKIVIFTMLVGGMVGVISRGGGMRAVVTSVGRLARTRRSSQLMGWFAGIFLFFDDYANCVIVGTTMRPITDRARVSRAKLAYLVDSTAAPVATLALISTWVGFQVTEIGRGLQAAGIQGVDPYGFFLESLPYSFYPILALVMVGAITITGRDFGPMAGAERAALERPDEVVVEDAPAPGRLWLAVLPIVTLLVGSLSLMVIKGRAAAGPEARIFDVLSQGDGLGSMMKGALAALVVAAVLALATRALTLAETTAAAVHGMRELFEAIVVLYLAWSLSASIGALDAAGFLKGTLGGSIPPWTLPTAVFVVACVTSFATGTSFGTMAILMPMVIPLAFAAAPGTIIPAATAASVLSGAVFGDHCSPISDTTVLSSLGAGCDLMEHVTTQLPYALVAGVAALALGTVPVGLGVPVWVALPLGAAAIVLVVRLVGRVPQR